MSGVEVEVDSEERDLCLTFTVNGRIGDIVLPELAAAAFRDGLWRTTCFEMFVRSGGDAAYQEFNWSPSMAWASYAFDDYRSGMRPLRDNEPVTASGSDEETYWLSAALPSSRLPAPDLQVGISVVIEEKSGAISYWALAHPPGPPDFHHADCFVLELPAASAA